MDPEDESRENIKILLVCFKQNFASQDSKFLNKNLKGC